MPTADPSSPILGVEAYVLLLPCITDVEWKVAAGACALPLNEVLSVVFNCADAVAVHSTITAIA